MEVTRTYAPARALELSGAAWLHALVVALTLLVVAVAIGLPVTETESASERYFPHGDAARAKVMDSFRRGWYASALSAMHEPSLVDANGESEVVRFLWLRTFHHPIAVRVESRGETHRLFAVELSGKGGYEPGEVANRFERSIDAHEFARLRDALDAARFWELPTYPAYSHRGPDGAQWVLEGRRGGAYQVVDVWSATGAYRDACLELLQLSGIDVPDGERY